MTLEEAIQLVIGGGENMREALEALVNGRQVLTRRIHFAIPAEGLGDEEWETIVSGSEAVSPGGDRRVIMPGAQRLQFEAGQELELSPGMGLVIGLSGATPALQLQLIHLNTSAQQLFLAMVRDPYDPEVQYRLQSHIPGCLLSRLDDMLQRKGPYFPTSDDLPAVEIKSFDLEKGTVTIVLDRDMAFERYEVEAEPPQDEGTSSGSC